MLAHAEAAVVSPASRPRSFLLGLALVTVLPLFGLPLALLRDQPLGLPPGSLAIAWITGPMHVATTAYFYFDRRFRPVLADSRARCLWSPVWLPLGLAALGVAGAFVIGRWAFLLIFLVQHAWLFHHYQRQNFGLISFISMHIGGGRLPAGVSTALNLAAAGGIISLFGTPSFYGVLGARGSYANLEGLFAPGTYAVARQVGTVLYVVSLVAMVRVFRAEPRLRQSAWLAGAFLLGMGFFLPTVLFHSVAAAFLPLAIAHGAQYILMMSVVSGRSERGWLGFAIMCTAGILVGLVLSVKAWPLILAVTGLVQVHFLVDARVWRLRERRQRAIMGERFDFLLSA